MHAAQFIVKEFQRNNGPKRDVGQQFDHILLYWFINVFVRQRNLGSWGLASGCMRKNRLQGIAEGMSDGGDL